MNIKENANRLTEKEIKNKDERLWQFAKEVNNGLAYNRLFI